MTIFIFDVNNRITSTSGAIEYVVGGLPFGAGGALVIADGVAEPTHVHNGWPTNAAGKIAVEVGGTTVITQNGLPLSANGRIVTDNTNPVEGFSNGLPYTANGLSIA